VRFSIPARLAAAAIAVVGISAAATQAPPAAASAVAPGMMPALAAASAQNALSGIWCASSVKCVAVGGTSYVAGAGRPLAETWNGKSWRSVAVRLPSGASFADLERLSCVSAIFCVAVGSYGNSSTAHLLAEFWDGRSWTPSEPPAPAGSPNDTLLIGVSCTSPKMCMAVGGYDSANPIAVAEKWNGAKWARVNPPVPPDTEFASLQSVSCTSVRYCVAVGIWLGFIDGARGVLAESWNGTAWRRVSAPSPESPDTYAQLTSVSCASAADCVAVGVVAGFGSGEASLTETWNGKAWATAKAVPWPKGTHDSALIGVSCPSRVYCVAVGIAGQANLTDLSTGHAAAATWNGKTWAARTVPVPPKGRTSGLVSVSCRTSANCAAVGYTGRIGSSASSSLSGFWNGRRWKLVTAI
jgi:hypothetical protein